MQAIAVCCFYILQLYYIHWLALVIVWWSLQGFLCRGSCHLQTVRVFQSELLLFLCLLWSLWLWLPKLLIIVVRVGTFVLFLILEEILLVFLQIEFYRLYCFQNNNNNKPPNNAGTETTPTQFLIGSQSRVYLFIFSSIQQTFTENLLDALRIR